MKIKNNPSIEPSFNPFFLYSICVMFLFYSLIHSTNAKKKKKHSTNTQTLTQTLTNTTQSTLRWDFRNKKKTDMKKDSALSALLRNKTSKIVISNTTTIIKNYGLTTVLNTFFDTFLARAFKMTHKHIKRKKKDGRKKNTHWSRTMTNSKACRTSVPVSINISLTLRTAKILTKTTTSRSDRTML